MKSIEEELEFQKNVCFNALMSADMTPSALFRTVEGTGATLLLDETENFSNKKDEKAQANRTLLMQGFLKDQFAIRSEGKSDSGFIPQQFNLFSPKSLAHIKALDNVLEDRCIQQLMIRSRNKEISNKWIDRKDSRFSEIRDYCYRLFLDYGHEINQLQEEARKLVSVSGREFLVWKPIITLALFFQNAGCDGLTAKMITKSSSSSESRQMEDEEEIELKVLKFIYETGINIEDSSQKGWKYTKSLYTSLKNMAEDYDIKVEYLTNKSLSNHLLRLGFKKKRLAQGFGFLIDNDTVKDCKERFGITELKQDTLS